MHTSAESRLAGEERLGLKQWRQHGALSSFATPKVLTVTPVGDSQGSRRRE
jgi:hypothetical protein